MPFNLGFPELVVILVLVLLLFGPKKLPDFARSMGQAIREFRRASQEMVEEIHRAAEDKAESTPAVAKSEAEHAETKPTEPAAASAEPNLTKQL